VGVRVEGSACGEDGGAAATAAAATAAAAENSGSLVAVWCRRNEGRGLKLWYVVERSPRPNRGDASFVRLWMQVPRGTSQQPRTAESRTAGWRGVSSDAQPARNDGEVFFASLQVLLGGERGLWGRDEAGWLAGWLEKNSSNLEAMNE
jgi:hypothetical protein